MRHSLLIVEDDAATATFLADNLAADGFTVATAGGADTGPGRSGFRGFASPEAVALYRLNALDAQVKGVLELGL